MDIESKRAEALKRMKALHLHKNVIDEFKEDEIINCSTDNKGLLFYLTEDQKNVVKTFEEIYNGVVYHVIENNTDFGFLYTLLYVSDTPEEWEMDREDLTSNITFAFVHNVDVPEFSEFGSIGFVSKNGGLVRVS